MKVEIKFSVDENTGDPIISITDIQQEEDSLELRLLRKFCKDASKYGVDFINGCIGWRKNIGGYRIYEIVAKK